MDCRVSGSPGNTYIDAMNGDNIMQLVYLGLLGTAIAGSYLVANRNNLGKVTQHAAIWLLIFVGVIGALGLWEDIQRDVTNRQAFISDTMVEVPRSPDGHYYLTLEINDVPVRFVIDTGASQMVLSRSDAERVGIDPETLGFFGSASTANGVVRTAPVILDRVSLGQIIDRQMPAVVNGGEMRNSLLGMTYLGQFDRIEITGDELLLTR